MTLISLIVFLIIASLIFWLVTAYLVPLIPVGPVRTAVLILFILICILALLNFIGYAPNLGMKL